MVLLDHHESWPMLQSATPFGRAPSFPRMGGCASSTIRANYRVRTYDCEVGWKSAPSISQLNEIIGLLPTSTNTCVQSFVLIQHTWQHHTMVVRKFTLRVRMSHNRVTYALHVVALGGMRAPKQCVNTPRRATSGAQQNCEPATITDGDGNNCVVE